MRHTGPYESCRETWEKFGRWAGPTGLLGPKPVILGVSYDDPKVTPPEEIRYDCCISVGEEFQAERDVGVQMLGGQEYAKYTHKGPYMKLAESYEKVCGEWLPQRGREAFPEPCIKIYLNDPAKTPEADLLTDIHVPLTPVE